MKNVSVFTQEGFSLLETMIALVILAIGLVSLLGLQSTALRTNQRNQLAEIGKDILVSEIDRIMPLTNTELQTQANVGQQNTQGALGAPYNGTTFNNGVDSATPADYDYVRWSGVSRTLIEGEDGTAGASLDYVVKIAIDERYLLQDVLARGQVTVYWQAPPRGVDSLQATFFTQRK